MTKPNWNDVRDATMRRARIAYTKKYGLPPHVKHNVDAYRNWGCRCEKCQADRRRVQQEERRLIRLAREAGLG